MSAEADLSTRSPSLTRDVKRGEIRSLTTAITSQQPRVLSTALRRPQARVRVPALRRQDPDHRVQQRRVSRSSPPTRPSPGCHEAGPSARRDPTLDRRHRDPAQALDDRPILNEVAEDSSPALETVLRQSLAGRAGIAVDVAAYEGTGVARSRRAWATSRHQHVQLRPVPPRQHHVGRVRDRRPRSRQRPPPLRLRRWRALAKPLRNVRVDSGGTVGPYAFDTGSDSLPTIWGAQGFLANGLAGGTAYVVRTGHCYLVNRTSAFDIQVDRSRLFNSDESEMRLQRPPRLLLPVQRRIVRGTAVPA